MQENALDTARAKGLTKAEEQIPEEEAAETEEPEAEETGNNTGSSGPMKKPAAARQAAKARIRTYATQV